MATAKPWVWGGIAAALLLLGTGIASGVWLLQQSSGSPPIPPPPPAGRGPANPQIYPDTAPDQHRTDFGSGNDRPPMPDDGRSMDFMRDLIIDQLNVQNLTISLEDIRSGGPEIDGILALVNPPHIPVSKMRTRDSFDSESLNVSEPDRAFTPNALSDDDRLIVIALNATTVAYPLAILNWHEVINDEVEGIPIAVTYCPLCDSAMVFDRRVEYEENDVTRSKTLEFGVSGLLANSNVLLYDRTDRALWSQLLMQAVSGPHAGVALRTIPVEMMTWAEYRAAQPGSEILSFETGEVRPYVQNPYQGFMASKTLLYQTPRSYSTELPEKTLGLGLRVLSESGELMESFFVPADAIDGARELTTAAGIVRMQAKDAGVSVIAKPESVHAVQTYFYAWSAFHPETRIMQ